MADFEVFEFAPLFAITVGLVTVAALVYGVGKKITNLENDNKNIRNELHDVTTRLEIKIEQSKTENKEDVSRALATAKEESNVTQKQIDSTKGDVKGLLAKIEVNDTRINTSEQVHIDLKQEDKDIKTFVTDWNQRIEDRIEALRVEFMHMISLFHRENGGGGERKRSSS